MSNGSAAMDRKALLQFFWVTGGKAWTVRDGWIDNASDLSRWFGIMITSGGRVVELTLTTGLLRGNNLGGVIPPDIGLLGCLKTLDLSCNKLSGAIPPELGQLRALEHLYLDHNQLDGVIPPELGLLSALERLHLSHNHLTGSIPWELGRLLDLDGLKLSNNRVSGPIPPELGQLTALERLNLADNELTGTIPPELGQLSALEVLYLDGNQLKGAIPPELGGLGALRTLNLSVNKLSGRIPTELGKLCELEAMKLAGNQLSGPIPAEFGLLDNLKALDLDTNNISGALPAQLGKLTALRTLDLLYNQLSGAIPPEFGKLSALEQLDLRYNALRGSIPAELGRLGALKTLDLDGNQFTDLGDVEDALRLVNSFEEFNLSLHNNPWRMPPEAVVEQGIPAVKGYLLDVKQAKAVGGHVMALQLLKVVLVGSSGAGKTSLMRSLVNGRGSPTEGTPEEASTVGIELLRHRLKDTTVEFYDCAGQLDYVGMHQTFLSRRAVYLLVWDVKKFHKCDANELAKVIHEDIMPWLYTLYLRALGSTVMMVASKCDGDVDYFVETAARVERRARELLCEWNGARGIGTRRSGPFADSVTLLPGSSRVSCLENGSPLESGLSALVDRISELGGGTSILVPPAWALALKVVDALRDGCEALRAAREHLEMVDGVSARGDGSVDRDKDGNTAFITMKDLSRTWRRILSVVGGEAEKKNASQPALVTDADGALEGALWISDFAGHILRVDGGHGIFLDVVWLSGVLKPVMDHKLRRRVFEGELSVMRDDLVDRGILRWQFARHLWRSILDHAAMPSEDQVMDALFRVLVSLGVALPLGRAKFSTAEEASSSSSYKDGDQQPQDMLVIMRLPERCTTEQEEQLRTLVTKGRRGAREVTLKWRFDAAGSPYGLLERLIASCHLIGELEQGLCWRRGAVFKSHALANKDGSGRRKTRLYTVVVRYDVLYADGCSDPDRVLTARMIGPLESNRVWVALRHVASSMVMISKDWPGVLWEGWPECPEHPTVRMYLATSVKAKIGGYLLPAADPCAPTSGCDCRMDEDKVIGMVVRQLDLVADTRKGDPFKGLEELPGQNVFRVAFDQWLPYAWQTSATLGTLAITVLSTATFPGILEDRDQIWKSSLMLVGTLLLAAAVAAAIGYRDMVSYDRPSSRMDGGGAGERRFNFSGGPQQYNNLPDNRRNNSSNGSRRDTWFVDGLRNGPSPE